MSEPLRVRDLMSSDVTTLHENDQLAIADDVMRLGRIRHLPVVNEESGELVGILSQRDLFRGALSRALGYGEVAQSRLMKLLHVKEVMSRPVEVIGPDAPLAEAASRMAERKLGCLCVVEKDRLVGILTEADFVRWAAREAGRRGR